MEVRRLKNGSHSELYHHGVKGQRWGVRRYQNYDGTLKNSSSKKDIRKKNTTGNSKGVYRRGSGLNGTTVATLKSEDLHGNITKKHIAVSQNKNLKSNQIGCKITANAKGEQVYSLQFKDYESLKAFSNTKAGMHLLSDPTAVQALSQAANKKGYLEWDENYINTSAAESMPFTAFTNISPEEQMNPGLIGMNDNEDEEYVPEDMSTHPNGTGVTIDMTANIAEYDKKREQMINSQNITNIINNTYNITKTIIKGLRMTPVSSSKKIVSSLYTLGKKYLNSKKIT